MHLTSHLFDEPLAVAMVSNAHTVITIHGCKGIDQQCYIGGLDQLLGDAIFESMRDLGIRAVRSGHPWLATHPTNICNRGRTGKGVQIEFDRKLRDADVSAEIARSIQKAISLCQGSSNFLGGTD